MANYSAILKMFQDLTGQANTANEDRYQDILQQLGLMQGQVGGTYDQVLELLGTLGQAEGQRIGEQAMRGKAQTTQSLISRGLGSTTILDSMQQRISQEENRARMALEESISGQKAGALMGRAGAEERMGGLLASFMERRTDQGPDLGMLMSLLQGAGAGEGAMGGSGGGGGGGGSLGAAWRAKRGGAFGGGARGGARGGGRGDGQFGGFGGSARAGVGLEAGQMLSSMMGPGSKGFFNAPGGMTGSVFAMPNKEDPQAEQAQQGGGAGGQNRTAADAAWRRTAKPYGVSMDEWMKDW